MGAVRGLGASGRAMERIGPWAVGTRVRWSVWS